MKKRVLITQSIPEIAIRELEQFFEVIYRDKTTPISKIELLDLGKDCFGILSFLSDKIDKEILACLTQTKIIANYAVGVNNIDVKTADELGIHVANTPDVLTDSTADLALALLLGVARRIVESDRYCRENKFVGWQSKLMLGFEFNNKMCGIIGFGRIGQAFAKRVSSLGMKVSYYSRTKIISSEFPFQPFDELVKTSDVISLHLPLTTETKYIFNKEVLNQMKKGSILINTGRGELIDESALVDLLESGKLFGAGLDVFENEPIINEKLKSLDNVILTPHIGSATVETRNAMAKMAAQAIISEYQGREYSNKVKP